MEKDCIMRNWWKYLIFIVYAILSGIAVSRHEPWFDEAQAWLIARDLSVWELLTKYMRYEGTPALWHMILTVPAKSGLPYFSLNVISGIFAAVSVYLFLMYSPFPIYVKLIFPFSFFAFYQYAVVARNYVLIPMLLFLIAMMYKNKTNRPYLFVFLLCLLANTSVHGLLISFSIMVIHMTDLYRERKLWSPVGKKHAAASMIFAAVSVLIVMQLWLPEDLTFAKGIDFDIPGTIAKSMIMLSDSMATNLMFNDFKGASLYSYIDFFLHILSFMTLFVTLYWLHERRLLFLYLLPAAALLLLFSVKYTHVWHQGILFFLWIFVMWINLENCGTEEITGNSRDATLKMVMCYLTAVLFVQTIWSAESFFYDFTQNYSASREAAYYIKQNGLDDRVIHASGFHSISILPYFDRNIFRNFNDGSPKPCFYLWSTRNAMAKDVDKSVTEGKPEFIIAGIKYDYQQNMPTPPGYRFMRFFDGDIYWKDRVLEKDAFALYIREEIDRK